MGICNGIFDLIGIASPYSIKLKILMKETLNIDNPDDWDSPVLKVLIDEWASTVSEALSEGSLQFIRSNHPPNAAKLPCLVAFFDGSTQAFCTVVYAVLMVNTESSRSSSPLKVGCTKDEDFIEEVHESLQKLESHHSRLGSPCQDLRCLG